MWDRSALRVDRLPLLAPVRRVDARAERVLGEAGLGHRKLICDRPDLAARLEPGLTARGWRAESLAVMAWPEAREPPAAPATTVELAPADALALQQEVLSSGFGAEPATATQLVAAARGSRLFAAPAPAPLALGRLWVHGDAAEIDDVGTVPAGRGQGHATAVVLAAVAAARAAGARLVFLRADERDWPWAWYARLGFEVVGRRWEWVRPARA